MIILWLKIVYVILLVISMVYRTRIIETHLDYNRKDGLIKPKFKFKDYLGITFDNEELGQFKVFLQLFLPIIYKGADNQIKRKVLLSNMVLLVFYLSILVVVFVSLFK